MLTKAEEIIKKIQERKLRSYFQEGDPSGPLTEAGRDSINSIKQHVENFSEYNRLVEEMIQNSEDSKSSEIIFLIEDERIIIENDGKLFNEADVCSITSVGNTTKQDDGIGMFGLGFKSVFALSDKPVIRSGGFNFSLDSNTYVIPALETPAPKYDPEKTYFILPLKNESAEEIIKSIRRSYQKIGELILFLRNLNRIHVKDKSEDIIYEKTVKDDVTSIHKTDYQGKKLVGKWLIRNRSFELKQDIKSSLRENDKRKKKKDLPVGLAFELDPGTNELLGKTDKMLYSFLATKYDTGLPFIINSHFELLANREGIKENSIWNKFIFDCAEDSFKDAVEYFKKKEKYQSTFYEIVPKKEEDQNKGEFLNSFYASIRNYWSNSKIILTESGGFESVKNCYSDNSNISGIITNEMLKKIENKQFLSNKIKKYMQFGWFSKGIKPFNPDRIVEFLKDNPEVIKGLTDEKLLELYSKLYEIFGQDLIKKIGEVKLIKTEKGYLSTGELSELSEPLFYKDETEHSPLYRDAVYFDQNLWNKSANSKDNNLKYFFQALDDENLLKKFDIDSVVSYSWLPLFQKKGDELFEPTLKIKNEFNNLNEETIKKVKEEILLKTQSGEWCKPDSIYFSSDYINEDLFDSLSNYVDIKILSGEYLQYKNQLKEWISFFDSLGVNKYFNMQYLPKNRDGVKYTQEDISCEILESIFKKFESLDDSNKLKIAKKIFIHLNDNWERYGNKISVEEYERDVVEGQEVGFKKKRYTTAFFNTLKYNSWIPATTGKLLKPEEVYVNEPHIRDSDISLPRIDLGGYKPNDGIIETLDINKSRGARAYIESLKNIKKSNSDSDLKKCLSLYSAIGRAINQTNKENIRNLLQGSSLIFLKKNSGDPWASPNECFLYSENSTIKKYIPCLTSLYDDESAINLFKQLNIKEYPSAEDYFRVLDLIKMNSNEDEKKEDVLQIYEFFNNKLKEQEDGEASDNDESENQDDDVDWWNRFKTGNYLLSKRGNFCNQEEIFFDDDYKLASIFEQEIDFLYIPTQAEIKIKDLLSKLKLKKVSEEIEIAPVERNIGKVSEHNIEDYIDKIKTYEDGIKELILKYHPNHLDESKNLTDFKIIFVNRIKIKIELDRNIKIEEPQEYMASDKKHIYLLYKNDENINLYKNELADSLAQFYNIRSLSGHIYRLIQSCIIEGQSVSEFCKRVGIHFLVRPPAKRENISDRELKPKNSESSDRPEIKPETSAEYTEKTKNTSENSKEQENSSEKHEETANKKQKPDSPEPQPTETQKTGSQKRIDLPARKGSSINQEGRKHETKKDFQEDCETESSKKENLNSSADEKETKTSPDEESKWTPEVEPAQVPTRIEEAQTEIWEFNSLSKSKSRKRDSSSKHKRSEERPVNAADKKAIGLWAEKYVYEVLKRKYGQLGKIDPTKSGFKVANSKNVEFEIVWPHMAGDISAGYDFEIIRNEIPFKYIEVKGKTHAEPKLIQIQGSQWDLAQTLFQKNKGEKYCFYVVSSAGTEDAKITYYKDPVKLWREGRLHAHPVNLEL